MSDTVNRPVGPYEKTFGNWLAPAPNTTYGTILPIAKDNQTDDIRFALPSFLRDTAQGFLQLLDGPATGTVTPKATEALANLSGQALLSRPSSPQIFAGGLGARNLKNQGYGDGLKDLGLARILEDKGASKEEILARTGWFKGVDGKWRWEIDDSRSKLNLDALAKNQYNEQLYGPNTAVQSYFDPTKSREYNKLSEVLQHPELYQTYPELAQIPIIPTLPLSALTGLRGFYDPNMRTIGLTGTTPDNLQSTLLHEIQHAIQHKQGFAQGGNTNMFLPKAYPEMKNTVEQMRTQIETLAKENGLNPFSLVHAVKHPDIYKPEGKFLSTNPEISKAVKEYAQLANFLADTEKTAYGKYQNLAGEAEARLVQTRQNMPMSERLRVHPFESFEPAYPASGQQIQPPVIDLPSHRLVPVQGNPFK